jgi:DAACS family dicarboxylate/amino acid:cation (Na+ or H+) symporter
MSSGPQVRGRPLHTRVLIGLLVGASAGLVANLAWPEARALGWAVDYVAQPLGQVFLRMLFMVVVPLVFASLVLGVVGLGDVRRLGRIGGKTFAVFLITTTLAVTLGLVLVNLVKPGLSLDPSVREALMVEYGGQAAGRMEAAEQSGFGIQTFINIVPRNPLDSAVRGDMLGLIFFSIVFGIAMTTLPRELKDPLSRVFEGILKTVEVMIGFAMRLAPYGVAGLIFAVTARFGFQILGSLGLYVIVVLAGLAIHQFGTLGLLAKLAAGVGPITLMKRTRSLVATAFSTSSSNATLPTTIRTAQEEFGVPREIAGFVLPLGATMNMNGTAIFEGVTVLFLAQAFGLELSIATQMVVVVLVILTAIGASGVPSGSIPLLILVLETVGVPGEGIALILGVDRILDMARTVPNVTGDLLTSLVIAKTEAGRVPADPVAGVPAAAELVAAARVE